MALFLSFCFVFFFSLCNGSASAAIPQHLDGNQRNSFSLVHIVLVRHLCKQKFLPPQRETNQRYSKTFNDKNDTLKREFIHRHSVLSAIINM